MYQDVRGRFSKLNDAEFKDVLKNMKVHPHKRVILSGYAENDDIRKALEAGIIHKFISKKMPMKQILETIRTLLQ
jgi:DNA-binding NarL/FixJ family response regulator